MLTHQPRFAFAVPDLLTPIRACGRTVPMPHERRRSKADLPALRLNPPANIDIVAGPSKQPIEAANRRERMSAERAVAAGYVLGNPIVEEHRCRRTWRSRNTL